MTIENKNHVLHGFFFFLPQILSVPSSVIAFCINGENLLVLRPLIFMRAGTRYFDG